MATIEDLLNQHRVKSEAILFKYTTAFKQLNKENAEEFFEGLAKIMKGFQSEVAASATDTFHHAIIGGIGANSELINGVLLINAEYGMNFSKALNG